MSSRVPDIIPNSPAGPPGQLPTVRWALRRTALGLAILFIVVAASAWLLHASIDPDEASASAPPAVEQDTEQK